MGLDAARFARGGPGGGPDTMNIHRTAIGLLVSLAMVVGESRAATCVWTLADGAWNEPANWSGCAAGSGVPAGTPGPGDVARLDSGTARLRDAGTVDELELNAGSRLENESGFLPELTVTSALRLAGGTLGQVGFSWSVVLAATAVTTLTAPTRIEKFITIENRGSWSMAAPSGNSLTLGGGTVITNAAGAVFTVIGSAEFLRDTVATGTQARFVNFGTFDVQGTGSVGFHGFNSGNRLEIEHDAGLLRATQTTLVFGDFASLGLNRAGSGTPAEPLIVELDAVSLDLGGPARQLAVPNWVTVRASGTINGSLGVADEARIEIGSTAGAPYASLAISGGLSLFGSVAFDIGGPAGNQRDHLVVGTQISSINESIGRIEVRFAAGLVPSLGDSFPLIDYAIAPVPTSIGSVSVNTLRQLAPEFSATALNVIVAPTLMLDPVEFIEGDSGPTTVQVPVRLSEPAPFTTRVKVQSYFPGTATNSGVSPDYQANLTPALDFAPGQTEALVPVIINGDLDVEADEDFSMQFAKANFIGVATRGFGAPRKPITIKTDDLSPGTRFVLLAGAGKIHRYTSDGQFIDAWPFDQAAPLATTGMCFKSNGDVIATRFDTGGPATTPGLARFSRNGALLDGAYGGVSAGLFAESCVQDRSGNLYVGHAGLISPPSLDAAVPVVKLDPLGRRIDTFVIPTGPRGTDWIDLDADQRTLHYTSEDATIRRFDVCTRSVLEDLATLPDSRCYALRRRPNGEYLVACENAVFRLSATGATIMSYSRLSLGETDPSGLSAMNLDPDGLSFWTAGIGSNRVVRVSIDDGAVLGSFVATQLAGATNGGLAIYGEIFGTTDVLFKDGFD